MVGYVWIPLRSIRQSNEVGAALLGLHNTADMSTILNTSFNMTLKCFCLINKVKYQDQGSNTDTETLAWGFWGRIHKELLRKFLKINSEKLVRMKVQFLKKKFSNFFKKILFFLLKRKSDFYGSLFLPFIEKIKVTVTFFLTILNFYLIIQMLFME